MYCKILSLLENTEMHQLKTLFHRFSVHHGVYVPQQLFLVVNLVKYFIIKKLYNIIKYIKKQFKSICCVEGRH